MQRLIDVNELLQKMENVSGNGYTAQNMIYMVKHAPTVEAEPVRYGKWIEVGSGFNYHFECSECGWKDGYPFNERHKYCPNCGAKMEKCENE